MDDLLKIIKERRSVRKFKNKDIPSSVIQDLIEAAIWAPSACNKQDWRFVVVKDDNTKKEIYHLGGAVTIKYAPACIVVCYDNRTDNREYRDDIQSAAAAIQNILLYAHHLNLGACWINHLPTKKQLKKLLNINKNFDPVGAVILGYPIDKPIKTLDRGNVKELISFNKFNFKIEHNNDPKKSLSRRIMRRIYYQLPKPIKITVRAYVEKYVKKFYRRHNNGQT